MREEDCEAKFSAERILGALLRATRAKTRLFKGKKQKKVTTMDGSSVQTRRDNAAKDYIEDKEKIAKKDWYLAPNTYRKDFRKGDKVPEISTFFEKCMKSHNQLKSSKPPSHPTKNGKTDEPKDVTEKPIKHATEIINKAIVSEALSFEMTIKEEAEVENDSPPPSDKTTTEDQNDEVMSKKMWSKHPKECINKDDEKDIIKEKTTTEDDKEMSNIIKEGIETAENEEKSNNILKDEDKVANKSPTANNATEAPDTKAKQIFLSTKLGPNTPWSHYTPTPKLKDITKDITKIMTPNAIIFTSKEEEIQNPATSDETRDIIEDIPKIMTPNVISFTSKEEAMLNPATNDKNKSGKKEYIRPGAILPDIIKMSNHVANERMSSKAFSTRCKNLLKQCKQPQECKAHTSYENVKKLSTALLEIYEDPKKIAKDWETDKTIHIGKRGYLNIASNHPLMWKEIEKVKRLTRILNISRKNLKQFKSEIKNQIPIENLTEGVIKDPINIEFTKENSPQKDDSPTLKRLKENYTYSRSTFKK